MRRASKSSQSISTSEAKVLRMRSVTTAKPFHVAVFFSSIHYLGIVALIASVACLIMNPKPEAAHVMVAAMLFCAITWAIAFVKRRSTFCPLCKGTPLINSGAMVHLRAKRVFPFNHGVTATLAIMSTQTFRCMYCGSHFDLLKTRSRVIHGDAGDDENDGSQGKRN